jgi:hypothetical protein
MVSRLPSFHTLVTICARKFGRCISYVLPTSRSYSIVASSLDSVPYLPICAGCLATTELGRCESKHVVIPYCSVCLASIGRYSVGVLAWILAAILSSLTACLFLSMLPWVSEGTAIGWALAFAVIPGLTAQIWNDYTERSQRTRAVFSTKGGLACRNTEWARQLGERMGVAVHSKQMRIGAKIGWANSGVLIALLATPWLYRTFHPTVRILNLTDDVIVTFVDEHKLAKVQLTSSENPAAGLFTRIPLGKRLLSARRVDGALVDQVVADVIAGHDHLFAPGRPRRICFWLERIGLGRSQPGAVQREVLAPDTSFWSIRSDVDVWFEPAAGSSSTHFTGGIVTALRQDTCPSAGGASAE